MKKKFTPKLLFTVVSHFTYVLLINYFPSKLLVSSVCPHHRFLALFFSTLSERRGGGEGEEQEKGRGEEEEEKEVETMKH